MGTTERNIGNLQEALNVFDRAIKKFPDNYEPLCEKASVLMQLGNLDEALEIYSSVRDTFNEPMKAILGQGEVHISAGRFSEALVLYDNAIQLFPGEAYPVIGRAKVLRESGQLDSALEEFEAAKVRFENEPQAYMGQALTLRDLRRLPEALDVFEEAVKTFRFEPYLHNGRASVIKHLGRLQDALKAYDENCQTFPYNLPALIGRVQLLKELERLDLASKAVESIVERHPDARYARHAKASILALGGHYNEALQLLPTTEPCTKEDWKDHHLSCMISLQQGKLDKAIGSLLFGISQNPFHRSKMYYQNALATAELKLGRYAEARAAAKDGNGAAAELIVFQSEAELGNKDKAVASLKVLQTDPHENIVDFAREISRFYEIDSTPPKHDKIWIGNRNVEINIALAA